ncbi:MAG: hypothetical protein AB2L22_06885 [Syntrophales bacterium]
MRKTFLAVLVAVMLAAGWSPAFGETAVPSGTKELLRLAPRISLDDETVSTFEISGTLDIDKIRLRFIASGKQPDRYALSVLDPRDGMPILVAAGNSYVLYDPAASEVLLGKAEPHFVFRMDPEDRSIKIGFGLQEQERGGETKAGQQSGIMLVDIHSVMAAADRGLVARKGEGNQLVVEGVTRQGGRITAYVTPSRIEGPYRRLELYKSDVNAARPFLVLDRIVLNRPLPEERFALSEEKLLAAVPSVQRVPDGVAVRTAVSLGDFYRVLLLRFVLADEAGGDLKPVVEKMVKHAIDWEQARKKDKAITPLMKAVFNDLAAAAAAP